MPLFVRSFQPLVFGLNRAYEKMISYIICYSQYGRFPGDKHWNLTTDQFTQECVHAIPLLTMYLHSFPGPGLGPSVCITGAE